METIPQANSKVEFKFRGLTLQGTIIRFRTRTSRKLQNMARIYGIEDKIESTFDMVEISVPGKGIYTVEVHNIIKELVADPAEVQQAKEFATNLVQQKREHQWNRKYSNQDIAEEHGLFDLKCPALVWIRYKGNILRQETMLAISPSFQIKFKSIGGARSTSPVNVYATKELAEEDYNKRNDEI